MSGVKSKPGPWHVLKVPGRPDRMRVQRTNGQTIEVRKSASGKESMFRTWSAASRIARSLNADAAIEAELDAKYAGLPPLPSYSFGRTIARAIGGAS